MAFDPCEFLPWDSEFFSSRIARVKGQRLTIEGCKTVIEWSDSNRIDCLYFLADADDPETHQVAEDHGFRFRDIRVTFDRILGVVENPILPNNVVIRPFRLAEVDRLREISRSSYEHTRFFNDPHFPHERCVAMYDTWIRKSCLENYADQVIIAELNGQVVGYVTCKLAPDKREGSIGLIGIVEEARNQRLGQYLIEAALNWFAQENVEKVSVVTQGRNIGAQRLYQKCGFATRSVQLWYHRWSADYAAGK